MTRRVTDGPVTPRTPGAGRRVWTLSPSEASACAPPEVSPTEHSSLGRVLRGAANEPSMKAFVVALNGQPFVKAGVGADGTLSANVTWIGCAPPSLAESGMGLIVHGIDSRSGEHVRWSVPEIGVGDEITIKIIETDQVSPEDERFRADMSRFRPDKDRVQRVVELNCRPGMGRNRAKSGEILQKPLSGESGPNV
jgi:hypothetical protein